MHNYSYIMRSILYNSTQIISNLPFEKLHCLLLRAASNRNCNRDPTNQARIEQQYKKRKEIILLLLLLCFLIKR